MSSRFKIEETKDGDIEITDTQENSMVARIPKILEPHTKLFISCYINGVVLGEERGAKKAREQIKRALGLSTLQREKWDN